MAAINDPQPPLPDTSADTEAKALLRQHQRNGIKPYPQRADTRRTVGGTTGRSVSGGGRIRGGR